jgi:hypothetical protein
MKEYKETKKKIERIAEDIISIEDGYDYSMRGVILDQVVSEYIKLYGERFSEMFKVIYDNQVEVYDTYGDADVSVKKLEIDGEYIKYNRRNDRFRYSCRAILLEDLCGSSGKFLIIEIVRESIEFSDEIRTEYHVRSIKKDIDKVGVLNYLKVDENFIVSYQYDSLYGWDLIDFSRLLSVYNKFKDMIDNLRVPYWRFTRLEE